MILNPKWLIPEQFKNAEDMLTLVSIDLPQYFLIDQKKKALVYQKASVSNTLAGLRCLLGRLLSSPRSILLDNT